MDSGLECLRSLGSTAQGFRRIQVSSCWKGPGLGGITDSQSYLSEHPGVRCPVSRATLERVVVTLQAGSWVGAQCVSSVSSLAWGLEVTCGSGPRNHCPPLFPPLPHSFSYKPLRSQTGSLGTWPSSPPFPMGYCSR